MGNAVYNLLLVLLWPAVTVYYLWRVHASHKLKATWRGNLGALPRLSDRPHGKKLVWLHAVSVGEVVASLPIQDDIRRLMPDAEILLTTITKTGADMALKSAKSVEAISFLPLDYPLFVSRAFDRVRPDILVIMEAEIWPNLLETARRRGIPVVLANGRVSDQAMKKGKAWRWLMSWAYANIGYCCMQTEEDAEHIQVLGARPQSVRVLGSTKFDQEVAQISEEEVSELRASLGIPDNDQVIVAGSTNPGEDEPVLAAFEKIRNANCRTRLIIAPRQINRADEITALAKKHGFTCARRSVKEGFGSGAEVLILDTLGELAKVYAVGDIAFVGGTLIPKGGHSLVQPILQGKPVLFGPHTFKTKDIARMAISAGVGFEVQDADELATMGMDLLNDEDHRARIDSLCRKLVAENQGASERCARLVAELLTVKAER